MDGNRHQFTNLIWKRMWETSLFSMLMLAGMIYFLYAYGDLNLETGWTQLLLHSLLVLMAAAIVGAAFGFYQNFQLRRKLEMLRDTMLHFERGNLLRTLPDMGEDEIGRLGEQLGRLGQKWEEQVTSLQRLSTDNAQLAEQAKVSAITEERQRLARELHDAVSQQLFAISMTATAVGRTLEQDFEKAKRQVALIEEMASVAQSEMRALLLHLRPVHLKGKSLFQGVGELIEELKAKVPMDIVLELDEEITLSKGVEDQLFRVIQEALSNILRHARADRTEVRLTCASDTLRVTIRDNGIGFDLKEKKATSYGLDSMRERVNEIGGSFHIVTAPGKGTRLDIRVPMIAAKEDGSDGQDRTD